MTKARFRTAQRNQVEFVDVALDQLLPDDHWVRTIWQYVCSLNLQKFHALIKAVEGGAGRDATDPRILLTLWITALSEGVFSARRLAELCQRDVMYRWICGGVSVNRDMLAAFMSGRKNELDELLTQIVAAMMSAGVVTLNSVAQDGMKVRAAAGADTFRREETLKECLDAAKQQVSSLRKGLDNDGATQDVRRDAARKRAAEEKLAAIHKAMGELPAVQAGKDAQKNKSRAKLTPARVSTTDAEARVMKMADGGFRPAWNPQFVTDVDSGVIVGVHVTNQGTDVGQAEAAFLDILERTGRVPHRYLMDGGYVSNDNIVGLTSAGMEVLAPVRKPNKPGVDPHQRKPGDPPEVGDWKELMATPEAKERYRARASSAERTNAELRTMGLRQLTVRGLDKVTSVVLLTAVAFNLYKMVTLMT
jgi:transposase